MRYTVYEVTNNVNGRTYVGSHATKNPHDSYIGSGKLIYAAIRKYGKSSFTKKILAEFDTAEEMFAFENLIVNDEYVNDRNTYNLCIGGRGGLGPGRLGGAAFKHRVNTDEDFRKSVQLNSKKGGETFSKRLQEDAQFRESTITKLKDNFKKARAARTKKFNQTPETKESWSAKISKKLSGRQLSTETKSRMKEAHRGKHDGENNNAFGKILINNGRENKQLDKNLTIPDGWVKGRLFKHQLS